MLEVVHKDQPLVAEEMVADHLETTAVIISVSGLPPKNWDQ